jgi:hypothetical protein
MVRLWLAGCVCVALAQLVTLDTKSRVAAFSYRLQRERNCIDVLRQAHGWSFGTRNRLRIPTATSRSLSVAESSTKPESLSQQLGQNFSLSEEEISHLKYREILDELRKRNLSVESGTTLQLRNLLRESVGIFLPSNAPEECYIDTQNERDDPNCNVNDISLEQVRSLLCW